MKKIYFSLFFLCAVLSVSAQSTILLKGKITDENAKAPLESATVYLTSAKDSTIIDYTITDKKGLFSLNTKKIKQPAFLKVSFIGYQDYKMEIKELSTDKDFGELLIKTAAKDLNEVVIKGEAPPIRIKKDTLEFNAASFKVRPDSNVEALLKQLPGVEITPDGKIKVNGKEVNNILVNGKPFFGKDGKVATQNLPAEIIDKVQISDTKTKEEELSGQASSSNEKTINLTIQEDKNKGLFGKFSGGLGTKDRYESSGLINYFKNKQKISFLGSSNNINSIGFSMDEVFDSMGGGRNIYSSGDGSFNIDGQQFGGGNGITLSSMGGINYADEYFKKLQSGGSYFFTKNSTSNVYRNRTTNFITDDSTPTGESKTYTTESAGKSDRFGEGHNLNFEFEYKIDSLTTLSVRPRYKKNISQSESSYASNATNDVGLVYQSAGSDNSSNSTAEFGDELYFSKKFKKKGRGFGFAFNNTNNSTDLNTLNNSETFYFQDPTKDPDLRHQRELNDTKSNDYYTRIGYTEPISDSLSITFRTAYSWKNYSTGKLTLKRDPSTEAFSVVDPTMTYGLRSGVNNFTPTATLNVRKKKYSMGLSAGTKFTTMENSRDFLGVKSNVNNNYIFPNLDGWFNYNISKSKSMYAYYNYDIQVPTVDQLLIDDRTSPLSRLVGETSLNPSRTHNLYLNFNDYDYAKKSGFYMYGGFNFNEKEIVTNTFIDPNTLINTTTYANIDNSYSSYLGLSMDKSIKKEQNTFKASIGINGNYNSSKGLTNNSLFEAKGISITPSLRLTYEYGELFTIQPSYSYVYNKTDYDNYSIDKQSAFRHNLKVETTLRWPKHLVFGNDLGYTYNSNIAAGFRKDFYLLNTSLGYNFFGDKLLAKVKVYDILNQNTNTSRDIGTRSITDMQNTVLKRYAMFSLTYKIEKFAGKKKNEWEE